MKKISLAALIVVLAAGILPGCGKSANNNNGTVNGVGGVIAGISVNGSSACVTTNTNQAISFPITGPAQLGVSGFSAHTSVGGPGFISGGNYYTRNNASGDTINLILNGSANSTGTVTGTVTLSAMTVSAVIMYGGGFGASQACVQGVLFNNTGVTAGSPGQLYSGMYLVLSNGQYLSM